MRRVSEQVSFRVTNVGTVIISMGDEKPYKHECDLPDEPLPTGTIVECDTCGAYWRAIGQRNAMSNTLKPGPVSSMGKETVWSKLGLFGAWYHVWRHK